MLLTRYTFNPIIVAIVLSLQDKLLLRLDETEHIKTNASNDDDEEVK